MAKEQKRAITQTAQDEKVLNSLRAGLFSSVLFMLVCFTAAILLIRP